ncbi:MAG TPA: type 4a pilus biogenesis protein PilO [Pyrinomonadaceae bacterium]|nr:type 4a pilus biogenesis protein PilO [Pyrinomonadaceae bacterium]
MRKVQKSSLGNIGDVVISESERHGPIITFAVMAAVSIGIGYLFYSYFLAGWAQSNEEYRQVVIKKETENTKTERMLDGEPHFRAEFKKIVDLYDQAKPLLPQETEVADVLGQVEMAAQRNGVTLTGLMAVKESIKSPNAEKLYEREIPAIVKGPYPRVVNFFADISRMPRILLVRDFSVVSLKSDVSAGFTLVAYHAPPPAEMPAIPVEVAANNKMEAAN